jgi:hypothetical protein
VPLRVRAQVEEVLLPLRIRPFLSHRRQDRSAVIGLKRELRLRGAGGWRDLDDLSVGHPGEAAIRRAISEETASFLWYGTRRALGSSFIRDVEMPEARKRKAREPRYRIVPLFTNISPGRDADNLRAAFQPCDGELLLASSGFTREPRERNADFHRRVADRYIRDAIAGLKQDNFTVAITAIAEPDGDHDLTLDWRPVLHERTRVLEAGSVPALEEALLAIRDAVKPEADFPELVVELDAPLPLAMLAGYAWRVTTRLRLSVRQRTRSAIITVEGDGPVNTSWPAFETRDYGSSGPCVIAVGVRRPLGESLDAYAEMVGAGSGLLLEVDRFLEPRDIRGLGRRIAAELGRLNELGAEKHLLLLGPAALAMLTGAGANATGPTHVPFWDGSKYVSPIVVG